MADRNAKKKDELVEVPPLADVVEDAPVEETVVEEPVAEEPAVPTVKIAVKEDHVADEVYVSIAEVADRVKVTKEGVEVPASEEAQYLRFPFLVNPDAEDED